MLSEKQAQKIPINGSFSGLFQPGTTSYSVNGLSVSDHPLQKRNDQWRDSLLRAVFTLPMRYADRRTLWNIPEFEEDTKVYVKGTVISKRTVHSKKGPFLDVRLKDALGHEFKILWFNFRAYQEKILQTGNQHIFAGKPKRKNALWTLFNPEVLSTADMGSIQPIYRKEGKEHSEQVKKRIRLLIKESAAFIPALFPAYLNQVLQLLDLPALETALRDTHWPSDLESAYLAHDSLKVAEMLWHMETMAQQPASRVTAIRPVLPFSQAQQQRLLEALPFPLSASQQKAWVGIQQCLSQPRAQDLLILGGVGSGKSALAFLAALAQATAPTGPNQVLLIAPTVILASQLYENLLGIAATLGLGVGLYGRDKYASDTLTHTRLWVGTHGLLTTVNNWDDIGLVVMDEEHRFGKEVKNLPAHVHRILMSATPIPNTLAQQRFGAMQLFRIRNDHHQRSVHSTVLPRNAPQAAMEQVQKTLLRQRKAIVVYAAVQERESLTLPEQFYFLHPQLPGDQAIRIEARHIHPDLDPQQPIETGKLARVLLPYSENLARQNPQVIERFYRLNKTFSAKKILEGADQLELIEQDLLLYDKDQPDRFFLAPISWLRKGKNGALSTKAILSACQQEALPAMPVLRGAQLLQGKSLESSRSFWEQKFPGKTAFLHGQMTDSEKAAALEGFRSGQTPLLIASNIVEVGIDVPGAETVVVADADRMGVASLVQIRGRVGRHGEPGYCFFLGSARDQDAMQRLEKIAREENDEHLAIQDFLERGFGSAGQAQSGNAARLFRLPRDARLFLKVAQIRASISLQH